jgi:hypothetical protein
VATAKRCRVCARRLRGPGRLSTGLVSRFGFQTSAAAWSLEAEACLRRVARLSTLTGDAPRMCAQNRTLALPPPAQVPAGPGEEILHFSLSLLPARARIRRTGLQAGRTSAKRRYAGSTCECPAGSACPKLPDVVRWWLM